MHCLLCNFFLWACWQSELKSVFCQHAKACEWVSLIECLNVFVHSNTSLNLHSDADIWMPTAVFSINYTPCVFCSQTHPGLDVLKDSCDLHWLGSVFHMCVQMCPFFGLLSKNELNWCFWCLLQHPRVLRLLKYPAEDSENPPQVMSLFAEGLEGLSLHFWEPEKHARCWLYFLPCALRERM